MMLAELERRAALARAQGAQVVVVMGLGFVGTAVAANLSRTKDRRAFFVEADRALYAAKDAGKDCVVAAD